MSARRLAAALAVALAAAPALSYILPATAILRLAARKRAEAVPVVELRGTFTTGETPPTPAALLVKNGRCRFELQPAPLAPGAPAAPRPYAVVRGGRVAAQRGLEALPSAAALAEGACALLAPGSPEAFGQALAARGVNVQEVALARDGARVAHVLGTRAAEPRPTVTFDKQTNEPLRLAAELAGAFREVRLGEWPPPPEKEKGATPAPADLFPRAIEVHGAEGLEGRFAIDRVTPNAKLPDASF
jgi:hypothetical protein